MTREEIRNTIFAWFKQQVPRIQANPHQMQQLQMVQIKELFRPGPERSLQPDVPSVACEVIQELITSGFLYHGKADDFNKSSFFTITEYGQEAFLKEDWLPYDPEGYVKALKEKVPTIDDITLAYIGEAVTAYNRRYLLSATITLGVASENVMLLLIEAYTDWMPNATRKQRFQKTVEGRFISAQYKKFKKELMTDVKYLPKEFRSEWETYLDSVFNFIRLNRNDAGHPTGRQFDAKVVYANLQVFADYAQFIFKLIEYLTTATKSATKP